MRPTDLRARGRLGPLEGSPESSRRLQEVLWRFKEALGEVTGCAGSFKSKEHEELGIILHMNAVGNPRGPVLRPAGLRARGRLGEQPKYRENLYQKRNK